MMEVVELNNAFSGMIIQQQGQLYSIFTPNGIMVCQVYMGNDQFYIGDAKCLEMICKILSKRWRVTTSRK